MDYIIVQSDAVYPSGHIVCPHSSKNHYFDGEIRVCGNIKGATFPKIPGARGLLKSCWHQQKSCSLGPIEGGKIASGVSGTTLK